MINSVLKTFEKQIINLHPASSPLMVTFCIWHMFFASLILKDTQLLWSKWKFSTFIKFTLKTTNDNCQDSSK